MYLINTCNVQKTRWIQWVQCRLQFVINLSNFTTQKNRTQAGARRTLCLLIYVTILQGSGHIERFDKKFVTSPCEQWDLEQFNHVQRRGSMVETNHCPTYLALERNQSGSSHLYEEIRTVGDTNLYVPSKKYNMLFLLSRDFGWTYNDVIVLSLRPDYISQSLYSQLPS